MDEIKQRLIDSLVADFKANEGQDSSRAAELELRELLGGFEVSELELLASQIKAKGI